MVVCRADVVAEVATCQFYLVLASKNGRRRADLVAKVATCQFYLVSSSQNGRQ